MTFTKKSIYSIQALIDLVNYRTSAKLPVSLLQISKRQEISVLYLEQLFKKLKNANIVVAKMGPSGGYKIVRPLESISLKEIIEAVEDLPSVEIIETTLESNKTTNCLLGITNNIGKNLEEISLASLI